jgi:hypothetical protein
MVGQTFLHYQVVEKIGEEGWAWSTRPSTPISTGRSP